MIVPGCMEEDEVMICISKVIARIAPRYVFHGYPLQDIMQESFIICMEGIKRYDCSRPLENFLSVHLSNRLKNFIRDNYYTNNSDEDRTKVMKPAQLSNEDSIVDSSEKYSIDDQRIDYAEMQKILDAKIPAEDRLDYLKVVHDVYVTKTRREEIENLIIEILAEHGYEKR